MRRAIAALLAGLALAAPAAADWLVTQDGARIETDGPWEIKGAVVLFTLPNGTLSSMRLSEVDLDKSAEATYDAENPPPPDEAGEEPPKKEPVLSLTNKDIRRAREVPAAPAAEGQGQSQGQDQGPAVAINEPYGLLDWRVSPQGDGVEIRGRLVNKGEAGVLGVVMVVALYTPAGVRYADTSAVLERASLEPGASTAFQASFPRVAVEDYRVAVEVEARPPRER